MSPERAATHEWTVDFSWKMAAAGLPFLFLIWLWAPFLPDGRLPFGSLLLFLALVYLYQVLGRTTVRLTPDHVSWSTLLHTFKLPWSRVRTVRLSRFGGSFWPQLQLVCYQPVEVSRLLGKRKSFAINIPSIPSLELYRIIRRQVGEERIHPKLRAFAASPVSKVRLFLLLIVQLPLILCWLFLIFRSRQFELFSALRYVMWTGGIIVVVGVVRQLLLLYLQWFEPESLLREVRAVFVSSSVQLLIMLPLGIRSDLAYIVVIYFLLWFFAALEVFGLLQILGWFRPLISPFWGLLVLAGFLFLPGPTLLWESRHLQTARVALPKSQAQYGRDSPLPEHVVWPDGRVAVWLPLPARDMGQLFFLDSRLRSVSQTQVRGVFRPTVNGDWLLWAEPDETGTATCRFMRFGASGSRHAAPFGKQFVPLQRGAACGNTAFGYSSDQRPGVTVSAPDGDPENGVTLYRLDLDRAAGKELFRVPNLLQAVQIGPDCFLWAEKDEHGVTVRRWSAAEEPAVIRRIRSPYDDPCRWAVLSPDFSHALFTSGADGETTVIRALDEQEWRLPIASYSRFGLEWSLPYVAFQADHDRGLHIFRLREDGAWEEPRLLEFTRNAARVVFAPDNRFAVIGEDQVFGGVKGTLIDMHTGQHRRLLLYQTFVLWNYRPSQTQVGADAFHYLSGFILRDRATLVKLRLDVAL